MKIYIVKGDVLFYEEVFEFKNVFCFVFCLGLYEVKEYQFFVGLNWIVLLRQKVEFIFQLDGEDDISYFDSMFLLL